MKSIGYNASDEEKYHELDTGMFNQPRSQVGLVAQSTPAQTITGNYLGSDGTTNTFDGLIDTPVSKIGQSEKFVRVTLDEAGLEYVDLDSFYLNLDGGTVNGDTNFARDVIVNSSKGANDFIVHGDTVDNIIRVIGGSNSLGFFNTAGVTQQTTGVSAATFVVSAGTAVNDASTFDGYTIKQVVKALRNYGLLN